MSAISSISSHSSSSVTQSNNTSRITPDFQVIASSNLSGSSSCFTNPFSPPVSSALSSVVQSQSSSSTVPLLIQSQSISSSTSSDLANQSKLFTALPTVVQIMGFSYLDLKSLVKCTVVNRQWQNIGIMPQLWNSFDLGTLFPRLRFFDERAWETCADLSAIELDVSDAPPLNKRAMISTLYKLFSSLPIEQDSCLTFLTIPKGLTLNKLIRLAANPKQGHITHFRSGSVLYRISEEIGDIPVDHTYRIAISNNVLTGSRRKSAISQAALVKEFGCQMPGVLEIIALIVTTHMYFGERLYNDSPSTFTRCSDQIDGRHLVVGGFGSAGLYVYGSDFDNAFYGVGCTLRKF